MTDTNKFGPGMEGEGNKTADKQYREQASDYAKSGKVDAEARKAERDVEEHPEEYEKAVEEGKRHSAGDLEKDLRGKPDAEMKNKQ